MKRDTKNFSREVLRRQLTLLLTAFWSFLVFLFLFGALKASLKIYPYLWGMSLEEKNHFLGGDLYGAARVCERRIPTTAALFFDNVSDRPLRSYPGHTVNFIRSHDRQKISYLLYPRRVYWDMERVKEPIRYVLVYHAKVELEGFEHLVDLAEDIYLLKMKETQ